MDIADFKATVSAHSDGLKELRAERRARAAENGKTVEQELDEFEQFIHCKEYVDILRVLLGVPVSVKNAVQDTLITNSILIKIASALSDPDKRSQIIRILESPL